MTKKVKIGIIPQGLTKEEILERDFENKKKELKIGQIRALVVKNQIVQAYTILENIRFDFISDTAFREKIVYAKRELEKAVDDFLLDENYWKKYIERYNQMSLEDYKIQLENNKGCPTQSNK